jgi:hypothetical protein
MLVRTVLYNPAPRNPSKFTNHLIPKAMNSLLHLQVESKDHIEPRNFQIRENVTLL